LWGGLGCRSRLLEHGTYREFTHESASRASSASVRTATPVAPFG
jgi:hypothetical protein